MNRLIIQINKSGEWCKLTSYEFNPNLYRPKRSGETIIHNRASALEVALGGMSAWEQHFREKLRLVEVVGYYGTGLKVLSGGSA